MACTRTRTTLQKHKLETAGILYEPRLCPEEDKGTTSPTLQYNETECSPRKGSGTGRRVRFPHLSSGDELND